MSQLAEVMIPKQGLCRFELKNFRQTATLPNVVLSDEKFKSLTGRLKLG
jgi:hypothetical protein